MESRTRFAIGGMSTVVASVAVVCAVALTNSVALADTTGVPIKAARIVVPTPQATSPADDHVTSAQALSDALPAGGGTIAVAEAVPAPAPIVVATAPPAQAVQTNAEVAVAAAQASGDWAPVRDWANHAGWDQSRIEAWIQRLEEKAAAVEQAKPHHSEKTSANADRSAERQSGWSGFGSKKDQSRDSPDRRD